MAKPPGERTKLIRQAITDHPGVGNTELAALLNGKKPGHDFTAQDFAQQRQAMKNLEGKGTAEGEKAAGKGGKKDETRPKGPATKAATVEEATGGLTADDLAVLRSLVRKVGSVDTLIHYLELLRDIR
jgi:hypothetical protein